MIVRTADIGHFSSQVTQFRLSQTHLPWPKCNTHSRPKDVGMIRKANKNQIFWSCYSERNKALKIYLDSLIFCSCITALPASCCVQQGSDSHWKPHTDTATTPVHPSQPLQSSYGSKGHVKNPQSHGEVALWAVPCLPRCHSWGGSGCSDVSHGQSACPWCSRNTAQGTPAVGEMVLMFRASCFQKSPLLHGWKTTQPSTSECQMLRATINAMN